MPSTRTTQWTVMVVMAKAAIVELTGGPQPTALCSGPGLSWGRGKGMSGKALRRGGVTGGGSGHCHLLPGACWPHPTWTLSLQRALGPEDPCLPCRGTVRWYHHQMTIPP